MLKLIKYFLWIIVLLALTLGFDQLLLKLPLHTPGLKQVQVFYLDFRSRLIGLVKSDTNRQPASIEAVIGKAVPTSEQSASKPKRYLYVDASGTLQFADSLQQVPNQYRQDAQPLAE